MFFQELIHGEFEKYYGHVDVSVFNNQELQVSFVAVGKSIVVYILLKKKKGKHCSH